MSTMWTTFIHCQDAAWPGSFCGLTLRKHVSIVPVRHGRFHLSGAELGQSQPVLQPQAHRLLAKIFTNSPNWVKTKILVPLWTIPPLSSLFLAIFSFKLLLGRPVSSAHSKAFLVRRSELFHHPPIRVQRTRRHMVKVIAATSPLF